MGGAVGLEDWIWKGVMGFDGVGSGRVVWME